MGEVDTISPRSWLLGQLSQRSADQPAGHLRSSQTLVEMLAEFQRERRMGADRKIANRAGREILNREANASLNLALTTKRPFIERLARFWSNHFCISTVGEAEVTFLAGAYEREAIRPHVLGKFENMVLASAHHPAMLIYLDQARSIGPNSRAGKRNRVGLNENYARELLELHTLGVNGGYSQRDVEALALMLTGWTIGGLRRQKSKAVRSFFFDSSIHEPGAKILLGKSYREAGESEGREAIRDLVRHPSTAQFIATKLARHFISDTPAQADIQKLASVFLDTQGDLMQVSRTLVSLHAPFETNQRKLRSPQDYLIALGRALGLRSLPRQAIRALLQLRHGLWMPKSPAGFGDLLQDWGDPDGLIKRIEVAQLLTRRLNISPAHVLQAASELIETRDLGTLQTAIQTQNSPAEAAQLLFASPDFQWR